MADRWKHDLGGLDGTDYEPDLTADPADNPTAVQLDEWALVGEDRMLSGLGWGRDDL